SFGFSCPRASSPAAAIAKSKTACFIFGCPFLNSVLAPSFIPQFSSFSFLQLGISSMSTRPFQLAMLAVHGTYRFGEKRTAFRNDFCANCRLPCRAIQLRTFDVHHIFWLPLIPLGFKKRWFCTRCHRQSDVYAGTRRPFKWIGLFLLLLFSPL